MYKKFTILPYKKRGSVTNTSLLRSDQLQGFENLFLVRIVLETCHMVLQIQGRFSKHVAWYWSGF